MTLRPLLSILKVIHVSVVYSISTFYGLLLFTCMQPLPRFASMTYSYATVIINLRQNKIKVLGHSNRRISNNVLISPVSKTIQKYTR